MQRHDGTVSNIFRPNLSEVHSGLWNLHVYSTSVCLLEILIGFMHVSSYLFLCFESRLTLCFVSCPPNHLEGEFWMNDCSAKWVWLFNDNAVITEAISLDLLRVIHIQIIFMTLYVQIDNLIIIHLSSPVNASLWFWTDRQVTESVAKFCLVGLKLYSSSQGPLCFIAIKAPGSLRDLKQIV